jgi:hypothetical protein
VWTDEGPSMWQAGFTYDDSTTAKTYIVDSATHVQKATTPGTSAQLPGPTFNDGGTTPDANPPGTLVWTDQGQRFWHPATYATNAVIVDGNNHLQLVTMAGVSGPTMPPFTSNVPAAGETTDGLQWTNEGAPVSWTMGGTPLLGAFILDNSSPQHVQQVVLTGTSAGTEPSPFSTNGGYTLDGSVVWIDRGAATYVPNHPYNVGNAFFDLTDIQQATTAGTSGASEPTFEVTTVTPDNAVVWTDEGPSMWQAGFTYDDSTTAKTYIVDSATHVQKATTPGTSGGSPPAFNDGGMTIDGLMWAFVNGPVVPYNPTQLYTLGQFILDTTASPHLQEGIEAGTSGKNPPLMWNHMGSTTIDNAVTWTESHPFWGEPSGSGSQTYTVGSSTPPTLILDTNNYVQLVTKSGISGPYLPSAAGNNAWNDMLGGMTTDGLSWVNYDPAPDTSVVARYPVTSVTTLQSAALDPLVSNCLNNVCTTKTSPSPYPLPTINNLNTNFSTEPAGFWLGDSASPTFYRLNFATGTYATYDASNVACPSPLPTESTCSPVPFTTGIQSLVPYGSEGSNQPDLAELFTGNFGTTTTTDAVTVQYLGNTYTGSVYTSSNTPPASSVPFTLWASPVNPASDFSDSPPIPNGVPCTATYPSTSPFTTCIVWKTDVFSLQSPPVAGDYLAEKFAGPSSITTNTEAYSDAAYDDTDFNGNFDPGNPPRSGSVQGLFQPSPTYTQAQSGCAYISPLPACYPSVVLPFAFQCPKEFPGSKLDQLEPTLKIVQLYPNVSPILAPSPITPLTGVNGTTNYAFYSSFLSFLDVFAFNWIPPKAKTTQYYYACTSEKHTPPLVGPFCVDTTISFILSPSCETNPWISAISPTSGPPGRQVTITGLLFEPGATVTFVSPTAEVLAQSPTIHPTSITTSIPSTGLPLGMVNVVVTNPNGLSYTLVNGFNIN